MNASKKRAAWRIAAVSILLASLASPLAWWVAKENAEAGTVALAVEESGRLLQYFDAVNLNRPMAQEHAREAARTIVGGLFDIAEIYGRDGRKLAEAMTQQGQEVERVLPDHGAPTYVTESYESLHLPDGNWLLRVFVPLHASNLRDAAAPGTPITGYFEGVRLVP